MSLVRSAVVVCALGLACGLGAAQKKKHVHASEEQLVFSAEDKGVQQPVAVPDDVKPVLAADEYVHNLLDERKLTTAKLPSAWFSASRVHLGGHKEDDLIVVGEGPVMGADGTTFWVFCPSQRGWELALKVSTHTLLVKEAKEKGIRELEARSTSAAEVFSVSYRYDGLQYHSYKEVSEPIK